MVTKIDNTDSSAPQIGLGSADMVVEELVEGGLTRLAVFFYSDLPDEVGPVRSMRASDIGIVSPVDGVRRHQWRGRRDHRADQGRRHPVLPGGRQGRLPRLQPQRAVQRVREPRTRSPSSIDQDERRPDDYLPWGDAADLPKGQKATTIAASFGGHATNWEFKNGTYDNLNTYAADG